MGLAVLQLCELAVGALSPFILYKPFTLYDPLCSMEYRACWPLSRHLLLSIDLFIRVNLLDSSLCSSFYDQSNIFGAFYLICEQLLDYMCTAEIWEL